MNLKTSNHRSIEHVGETSNTIEFAITHRRECYAQVVIEKKVTFLRHAHTLVPYQCTKKFKKKKNQLM